MPKKKNSQKKRPIAVTVIVLLAVGEILLRVYWVTRYTVENRIWVTGIPWPLWGPNWLTAAGSEFATAAFRLLWVLVGLVVLIGLLSMRRWSWVALVTWTGVSLSVGILHYLYRADYPFSPSDFAVMAADMVLVFALNQSEVQQIYGIRSEDVQRAE